MKRVLAHAIVIVSVCVFLSPASATTDISANKLVVAGLELQDIKCSLKGDPKQAVLGPFGQAVAAQRKALEACDPKGGSYRVGFKWKAGKLRGSKVRKASNRKAKRCIAKSIKAVNPALEGMCRVTILLKKTAPEPSPPKVEPKPKTKEGDAAPAPPKTDPVVPTKSDSKNDAQRS